MPSDHMLKRPESVIRLAPTSGVFGTSQYMSDEEGFCAKVITRWYSQPNNTIPMETPQHMEAARQLFPFYRRYRKRVDAGAFPAAASVLKCLYDTGRIESADALLGQG